MTKKPTKQKRDPHPMQDVRLHLEDGHHVSRFRSNAIVEKLLDVAEKHGMDMNAIARMDFTPEDRTQFAQLLGYSVSGFMDLSYVDDESWQQAVTKDAALRKGKKT